MNTEATTTNPIETALAKENITAQVLDKIKMDYKDLSIAGIDDVKGYDAVKEAKNFCMRIRTNTVKICKLGREDANRIQKEWIAKEKEVVGHIEEVEGPLAAKLRVIDEAKEQILFEAAQKQKLPYRLDKLAGIEISLLDDDLLKLNDDDFNKLFNELHAKHLEEKQARLDAEQKRIDEAKAERERKEKAEFERIKKQEEDRINARENRLIGMGFKKDDHGFFYEDLVIPFLFTVESEDSAFDDHAMKMKMIIKKREQQKADAAAEARAAEKLAAEKKEKEEAQRLAVFNSRLVNVAELGMKLHGDNKGYEYSNIFGRVFLSLDTIQHECDGAFFEIINGLEQSIQVLKQRQQEADEKKAKEAAAAQAKAAQEAAEAKKRAEEEAKIEAELSKGDAEKFGDLLQVLEDCKTKFTFKSAKYKKLQAAINDLIDKTVAYGQSKK